MALLVSTKDFWSQHSLTIVCVGAEQCRFPVPTLVLRRIPWFQKCLDAGMQEAHSNTINLPEDNPLIFAQVINWLHTGNFTFNLVKNAPGDVEHVSSAEWSRLHEKVLEMFVFATKLCYEKLQNFVIDTLIELWRPGRYSLSVDHLKAICDYREPSCSIYRWAQFDTALVLGDFGWDNFKQRRIWTTFALSNVKYMAFITEALAKYPNCQYPTNKKELCRD